MMAPHGDPVPISGARMRKVPDLQGFSRTAHRMTYPVCNREDTPHD